MIELLRVVLAWGLDHVGEFGWGTFTLSAGAHVSGALSSHLFLV